jgi:myo-inositol-1(or 4)-monophosphatase
MDRASPSGVVMEADAGAAHPGALLALAAEAAEAAGALLLTASREPAAGVRAKSTATDLVSEADFAAERAIRELLSERRPGDRVLGEEGGEDALGDGEPTGVRWVVDPLDGTINFLFGLPQWCVSVACEDARGTIAGVVYDPSRGETFAATRDGEPTADGRPVLSSPREDLATALVATGFAYDADVRAMQAQTLAAVLPRVRDIRRMGSAALDLAWTACGRYDAYFERGLNPWDAAAGALICSRAGLEVRVLEAAGDLPGGLAVASPALIDPLLALVG